MAEGIFLTGATGFEELYSTLPITTDHELSWTQTTKDMYRIFEEMGLSPVVTPKLMCHEKCIGCGHCAIGCPTGAKWDTRSLVDEAVKKGARLITGCHVLNFKIENDLVTEVYAKRDSGKKAIRRIL